MRYLDGKPTNDKRYLAQQYVTSLSLLLVAAFKASLCGSLAVAFTQHTWKVLRHRALRVSAVVSTWGTIQSPTLWRLASVSGNTIAVPYGYGHAGTGDCYTLSSLRFDHERPTVRGQFGVPNTDLECNGYPGCCHGRRICHFILRHHRNVVGQHRDRHVIQASVAVAEVSVI